MDVIFLNILVLWSVKDNVNTVQPVLKAMFRVTWEPFMCQGHHGCNAMSSPVVTVQEYIN